MIAALIVVSLPAACVYSYYRLMRTEPTDSPIVQVFLIRDDHDHPREVFGPNIDAERVTDARLDLLQGLPVSKARQLVEHAGLSCGLDRKDTPSLHCDREFSTIAGPGFWHLDLRLDEQDRVASLTATRFGHCPHR